MCQGVGCCLTTSSWLSQSCPSPLDAVLSETLRPWGSEYGICEMWWKNLQEVVLDNGKNTSWTGFGKYDVLVSCMTVSEKLSLTFVVFSLSFVFPCHRFIGRTGTKETMEASALCQWMGRILKYRSHHVFLQSGSHTNLRGREFDTKSRYASRRGSQCGSTDLSLVELGVT